MIELERLRKENAILRDALHAIAHKDPLAAVTGDAVIARKALQAIDSVQVEDTQAGVRYVVEAWQGRVDGVRYTFPELLWRVKNRNTGIVIKEHDTLIKEQAQAAADSLNAEASGKRGEN